VDAQKELIEKGTTVLESVSIDDKYARRLFADAG